MAYKFVKSSTQSLRVGSSPVSGVPLTVAFWITTSSVSTSDNGVSIENTGANSRFSVGVNMITGALNAYAQSLSSSSTFATAQNSAGSMSANTLYHIAGVFSANNSRSLYVNGTLAQTNTSTVSVGALNCVSISESRIPAYPGYGDCQISELGLWSVALMAAEIASLADAISCRLVRPQSLAFYAPLIRDLVDVKGGVTITNNNSATVVAHPRVYA